MVRVNFQKPTSVKHWFKYFNYEKNLFFGDYLLVCNKQ